MRHDRQFDGEAERRRGRATWQAERVAVAEEENAWPLPSVLFGAAAVALFLHTLVAMIAG